MGNSLGGKGAPDKGVKTMSSVRADIEAEERRAYGESTQDAVNNQTIGEMLISGLSPGYHNKALIAHNNRMIEVNKKRSGQGAVKSFEELRDTLLSKGFSAEDAERIAKEEMASLESAHSNQPQPADFQDTHDEFSYDKFKPFKVMKRAGADHEQIRMRMKALKFSNDLIDRFIAHTA
jgi:hypothetical protein